MKSNFAENMISLVSFVYNVLTQADPQRSSALQEMFVFLSRVLAKHTRAGQEREGGCNIIIGYQNILHASHGTPPVYQHMCHIFFFFARILGCNSILSNCCVVQNALINVS